MSDVNKATLADFEIRGAVSTDLDALFELSKHLNSVNLPHDRNALMELLERSEQSFSGAISDVSERHYVFVLVDTRQQRIVGTSMVIAQLGRRGIPYIYLDVHKEEKYSSTLDLHKNYQVLRMGYSYDGPTEIGGLVMHPEYRRLSLRLGQAISYVRFLWIAMHRSWFQDDLLAELMPPLRADGTSVLWEAIGGRIVDMTYQEADKLSKTNKEFIWGLFPSGDIYTALLDDEAQAVIGEVGPDTKGVEKILKRIGFRYVSRVDPFDGGPHFMAAADEVSAVSNSLSRKLETAKLDASRKGLIAIDVQGSPWFRARLVAMQAEGDSVVVDAGKREAFTDTATVWSLPF